MTLTEEPSVSSEGKTRAMTDAEGKIDMFITDHSRDEAKSLAKTIITILQEEPSCPASFLEKCRAFLNRCRYPLSYHKPVHEVTVRRDGIVDLSEPLQKLAGLLESKKEGAADPTLSKTTAGIQTSITAATGSALE